MLDAVVRWACVSCHCRRHSKNDKLKRKEVQFCKKDKAALKTVAMQPAQGARFATVLLTVVTGTLALTCDPLPAATQPSIRLLGQGLCQNAESLTPVAYKCNASEPTSAPDCALLGTADSCAAMCLEDDGCTGFELRLNAVTGAADCYIFFSYLPTTDFQWIVGDNGTQYLNSSRLSVVSADGNANACCYKRAYPRPCPLDNPIIAPPKQSPRAQEIFARMNASAQVASDAALPALEAIIAYCSANATNSSGLPANMFSAEHCPGMADLTANGTLAPYPTPQQIIQRFGEEMLAAEFGHGYAPAYTVQTLMQKEQVFNPSFPVILNLFAPVTLGLNVTNPPVTAGYNAIMMNIFGCDPFDSGATYTLNYLEAANRITYTAMNWRKSPVGNILSYVGLFDVILRPSYVRDMMLITPTDSGHYEKQFPTCVGWPNCTVGTIDNVNHILYAWMTGGGPVGPTFTPVPTPTSCASQMQYLQYTVCSMPPNRNNPVGLNVAPTNYMEADALGTIRYPEGVKLAVASFKDYFGTWDGSLIRKWCLHNKWILGWVLHNGGSPLDNRRLLDPYVLAGSTANATVAANIPPAFEAMWTAANVSRTTPVNFTNYAQVWGWFVNETNTTGVTEILTWNIGFRDCIDSDNCIGIADGSGLCVCYAA